MAKKDADDILTGDYVSAIGVRAAVGKLQAVEIRVYPESMRGLHEGQGVANAPPGGVVTNATVAKITKASDGTVLALTFRGGGADYIAGADVPVLSYAPGSADLLKAGAAVYATGLKKPDGSLTASQLIAEKNGVKPPF
jgi:hypothetical protein